MNEQLIFARDAVDTTLSQVLQVWSESLAAQVEYEDPLPIPPIWDVARDLSIASNSLTRAIYELRTSEYQVFFGFRDPSMEQSDLPAGLADIDEDTPPRRRNSRKKS